MSILVQMQVLNSVEQDDLLIHGESLKQRGGVMVMEKSGAYDGCEMKRGLMCRQTLPIDRAQTYDGAGDSTNLQIEGSVLAHIHEPLFHS